MINFFRFLFWVVKMECMFRKVCHVVEYTQNIKKFDIILRTSQLFLIKKAFTAFCNISNEATFGAKMSGENWNTFDAHPFIPAIHIFRSNSIPFFLFPSSLKQFHFFLYFFVSHYSRNKRREVRKECKLFKRQNANESFDRSVSVFVNYHRVIYVLIWERYQAITQIPFKLMSLWLHPKLMW